MATKKGASKKGGAKKGAGKKAGSKKAGSKKAAIKTAALAATSGSCLDLSTAGLIVQSCVPNPPQPVDSTLEAVGLISNNQRLVFRECVFNRVLGTGCHINRGDIPNGAENTLREVRDAIKASAE